MFCNYCSQPNPEDARYCSKCGRQLPTERADSAAPPPPPSQAVDAPSAPVVSAMQPRRPLALAGYLAIGTVVFGGMAAFSRRAYDPYERLGLWFGALVWPLLIAFVVRGRKGDWYGFARWYFWLTLLIPSVMWSVTEAPRQREERRWRERTEAIAAAGGAARARLTRVFESDVETVDDFVARFLALPPVIDQYAAALSENGRLLADGRALFHRDQVALAQIEAVAAALNKDLESVSLMREQIDHARRMAPMTGTAREAYYQAHIPPLLQRLDTLAQQQQQFLREAERHGVRLPDDIRQDLKR